VRPAVVLGTNLVVGAAVLGWALHQYGAPALALLAAPPSLGRLGLFGGAVAAVFLGFGLRWQIVLAGLGVRRGLTALTAWRAAGQSLSTLIPSAKLGGEPLRAVLLVRDRVPAASAIASVAVDRTLEMGAAAPFACLYAALLLRRGVPQLEGALVTVSLGAAALLAGIVLVVRRLRRRSGLVTTVARSTGLDRLRFVQGQMGVLGAAEGDAARLVRQPRRLARAFAAGVAANLIVLLEYHLLLSAFGLPSGPLAVVAATFATGAAHSLPVPAAVGALEGAQMWLFGTLGHPPEVGLAVGLAVRLRELVWVLPGILYLTARGVGAWGGGGDVAVPCRGASGGTIDA
jgi:uncharacterized protein (TIRG00374 family)